MPVHLNQIGETEFLDLVGPIGGRQERVDVFERPGVEGVGARKMKRAGPPFQLVSVLYVEDFDAAAEAFTAALDLVGSLVAVVRNDVDYGTYLLMSVEENSPPQAVDNVIGGVTAQQDDDGVEDSDLNVRQELRWTLIWNADPLP